MNNFLVGLLLGVQASVLILAYFGPPLLTAPKSMTTAYWAHVAFMACILAGDLLRRLFSWSRGARNQPALAGRLRLTPGGFWAAIGACVLGVVVASYQMLVVADLTASDYWSVVTSGYSSLIADAREDSAVGGLPGIVKLAGFLPLSIFLCMLGLFTHVGFEEKSRKQAIVLLLFSLAATIGKIMFSLDRLTIVALCVALLYVAFKDRRFRPAVVVVLVLLLMLADFVSRLRLEAFGFADFAFLYSQLGLVNFQLAIDTLEFHTLGTSTLLYPLNFVFRFFGSDELLPEPFYEWEWNPAQYFFSHAYFDFGFYAALPLMLVGYLLSAQDAAAHARRTIPAALYFPVTFIIASSPGVIALRGIDTWLVLVSSLLFAMFAVRRVEPFREREHATSSDVNGVSA